jgi:hypothetical protein
VERILVLIEEHLSGIHRWKTRISHIVEREYDEHMRLDACTNWGMGGHSADFGLWRQIKWSELGAVIVIASRDGSLHVNVLELTAAMVQFFGGILGVNGKHLPWRPKLGDTGDNTTSICWYYKFSNPNPVARSLMGILAEGRKFSSVNMDISHVALYITGLFLLGISNDF